MTPVDGSEASSAAPYLNALIILTTVHAQDFRDEIGDRLEKRLTIPIVMPTLGRLSMPVGLLLWSLFLGLRWSMSPILSTLLAVAGMFVGARFYLLKSPEADRKSYLYYNMWLAMARIVPVLV
ncbi:hypothetical protein PHLCEN_2v7060 [Hermanssonia centrifuga]|uniref:Uncharacterized protein n=1 Tax=Hermanssonia centrifuga TaxID=98765 RepID=A0A2R6NXS9_9APHY|nr:hypothetical protein PHLCEN_2v7060 [Hermanssonia centrifuga]